MSTVPPPLSPPAPRQPDAPPKPTPEEIAAERQQRTALIIAGVVGVLLLAGLIFAAIYLVGNPAQAATVRDVFIIFMALESIVIGVALVILIIQMAVLTNLLKNEIKPILEATQDTVNTVRGTAVFVSENLTEPIVKLNSYVAGLTKVVDAISAFGGLFRRP